MQLNLKIFVLLSIIFSVSFAQKKEIRFEHLTVDDGLSANTVFCMLQDSRGFLWIGTYDGLNRYDGYNFKIYKNVQLDSTSLSENKIRALCEDRDGNIWIGTWGGGLNKFVRNTEKFEHFRFNPNNFNGINSDDILSLLIDKTGNIWIGTEGGGLDYFDPQKKIFYHYKHDAEDPNSLSGDMVASMYEDSKETIWICTNSNGLNKFIRKKNNFIVYKHSDDNPQSISSNQVTSIIEDQFGVYWVGTRNGGLNRFDPSKNIFTHFTNEPGNPNSLSDTGVWTILEDSDGILWIGNYSNGLNKFNRKDETFTSIRKNYNDPQSLSDDGIFSIYEDRSGILWFGTWSGGLNKYDKLKEKFLTYSLVPGDENSLSSNMVYAIYKDKKGILWVGTQGGGLNRIDEKENKVKHFNHKPDDINSLSSDYVYSICEDHDGYIWVSTDNAGINKFDQKTNKFQRFQNEPGNPNSLSSNSVSLIFIDSFGDLWAGVAGGGIERLKKNEKNFIHYVNNPSDPKSISSKMVYSIYEDKARNLWIGTYGGGLMRYNRTTDDFTFYIYDPNNIKNSLSSNIVSSVCEDDNGILWIGTTGAGLNKFNRENNTFKHYGSSDGLANDVICGILADDEGNLWISTGSGVSKFNIRNEIFRNYDSKDGLQGNEFNAWAYFKSSTGEIYFGGVNGFNVFHPKLIKENSFRPPVEILNFRILHKPVNVGYDSVWMRTILEKSISETNQIDLNHDENIISFEIAALDFHSPEKNKYAYTLEAFDKNWIYTDASRREITYTNLDHGEYTLKIKGSNNDGVWNEAITSLKIIIHSPWWAKWWAYVLYTLIVFMVFAVSTRIYINRRRLTLQLSLEHEHARKLEEVDQLKTHFYTNISHEFRTPLTLILGPADALSSRLTDDFSRKQIGLIKGNANRLLNLINQLLDLSKIEAGRLELQASAGNISLFIKGLVMEFEAIAEKNDINLKLVVEKDEIELYFDRDKMEKIMTNLLSNAFKFTPPGGTITVTVKQVYDNFVEITITDTGIGIRKTELTKIFDRFYQVDSSHSREHEGTGIGLALTKELVELHQGKISVESEEGEWTKVKLIFPLGKDYLLDTEIAETPDYQMHTILQNDEYSRIDKNIVDSTGNELIDKTIILVVDDNSEVRDFIKSSLEDLYHVEEASNGEQGLRKAQKFIPDMIISDIMMPKMDGYEMTRKLKDDEKTSHIPIILLTAKSDQESKIAGLNLGVDDYLVKPFDTKELLVRVKNIIELRKILHAKFSDNSYLTKDAGIPKLSCIDEEFMKKIMTVIEKHISEEEFSIEEFGKNVGMSRSQMHRKLKALTGKSASVYLRTVRLLKAKQMIQEKRGTISEIAYKVGFSSLAYFSRCFKEEFGHAPSDHSG